jgi:malate dehydrogenase
MLNKIGLIGGGNIGGVLMQEIVQRKLAREVALVDIKEPDLAKGKALDIAEGSATIGVDVACIGGKDYDVIKDADVVINTAGVPRTTRPDGTIPTREELLATNLKITDAVSAGIQKNCPNAFIVSVANPLDAIVYRLYKNLNPPKNKLMGMAGALDSGRYRHFIAYETGIAVENITAMVLGGHGDTMLPIRSACRVAGMPVEQFVAADRLAEIETRTRKAGGEIVKLLGSGSAFVSPAWGALDMVESIAYDAKKIIPSCVLLTGEYGVDGLFIGVPVVLGKDGVEKEIEMDLTADEKEAFGKSVAAVQKTVNEVNSMV